MVIKRLIKKESVQSYLIFGLGNPGREYALTRHNIGFLIIDQIAKNWGVEIKRHKFRSVFGEYRDHNLVVKLIKPMTFMNNSGEAVRSFVNFYKASPHQVLVIFDDLDLPFGTLRFRKSGGSSGQKGMESIITKLGTENFPRLRVGIGRPPGRMDVADFILKPFRATEQDELHYLLMTAADAVKFFINHDIEKCMTKFNQSVLNDE